MAKPTARKPRGRQRVEYTDAAAADHERQQGRRRGRIPADAEESTREGSGASQRRRSPLDDIWEGRGQ